jgi:hypothetical protein
LKIRLAHLKERSTTGGWINFAVFDAKSTTGDNATLLQKLTLTARASGLRVDQSALAYHENGQVKFFGDRNLVSHLATNWSPQWTHTLDV